MKRFLLSFILIFLFLGISFAQGNSPKHGGVRGAAPSFDSYLRNKCDMVVHELELSPADSARFIPIYEELLKEKSSLFRKYGGGRRIRFAVENGEQVADTTLMRVIYNSAQLQVEDAQLEQRYLIRLSGVLTPLQIYKLQKAEQKFRTDALRRTKRAKN